MLVLMQDTEYRVRESIDEKILREYMNIEYEKLKVQFVEES